MRIPLLIISLLIASLPALALDPPAGWTSTGEHTAIRDPRNPNDAEIREFVANGANGDPDELRFILMAAGLSPQELEAQSTGSVHMMFGEHWARARFRPDPVSPSWLVLFVAKGAQVDLDPDAVLASLLPLPVGIGKGNERPTALDSGQDGDPWGEQRKNDSSENVGWLSNVQEVKGWSQDQALVGKWEGSAFKIGEALHLSLRLESDGMMVLQVREDGKTRVYDGNWATLDGILRLDLGDGQVSSSSYEVLVNSLKIRFDGIAIDLGLRR